MSTDYVKRSERILPSLIILIPLLSVVLVAALVSYVFISNHHNFQVLEAKLVGDSVREQSQANLQREVERAIEQLEYHHDQAERRLRDTLTERSQFAANTVWSLYDSYVERLGASEINRLITDALFSATFEGGNSYFALFSQTEEEGRIETLLPLSRTIQGSVRQQQLLLEKLEQGEEGLVQLPEDKYAGEKLVYIENLGALNLIVVTVERMGRFRDHLKQQVLAWLGDYRFGQDGYLFVYSSDGYYLMNPHTPSLAGRRVDSISDIDGKPVWEEFLAAAQTEQGRFVRYRWTRPGSDTPVDKLTFAMPYPRWGWVIATGVYVDDMVQAAEADQQALNQRMENTLQRTLLIVVTVLAFTFILTLLVARFTTRLLRRYHQQLLQQNDQLCVWNTRLEQGIAERTRELELKNIELNRLSTTDALTGLNNRLRLDQFFDKVLNLARRYDRVFSIILLDLDRFKSINDNWGHPVGDQVLVEVGRLIEENIRDADMVGRWGGEEFLLILPETGSDQAAVVAEMLRGRIEGIKLDSIPEITCSFGVTSYLKDDSSERMLARADQALYQAKHQGRNLVEVA